MIAKSIIFLVLWEILTCTSGDFQLAYGEYTDRDPNIEDMKSVFLSKTEQKISFDNYDLRPDINPLWKDDFEPLIDVITECWSSESSSRPSCSNVMKRITNAYVKWKSK